MINFDIIKTEENWTERVIVIEKNKTKVKKEDDKEKIKKVSK